MGKRISLKQVMTPVPYRVSSEAPLVSAKQEMHHHNVRHLPVVDGESIVGILSQRDIAVASALAKHVTDEDKLLVKDVCSLDPYIVDVGEHFDVVLLAMAHNRYGSAIVTEEDQMVGIITTTDVCRVCGEYFRDQSA